MEDRGGLRGTETLPFSAGIKSTFQDTETFGLLSIPEFQQEARESASIDQASCLGWPCTPDHELLEDRETYLGFGS